ncbi:GtrA family protein [Hydrogenophaga sp.]|uniref:GtrA family protein n=1 Tax=Hydrogenophaga sp. TaxID=1904254 RepID=UPI002631560F|nr:GtrA family protein [Hydrogenophaga sp.]MCW5653225.1 GtrA family protein [Hydrogenophaga sp.]
MSRASGAASPLQREGLRLWALFLRFASAGAVGTAAHYLVLVVLVSGLGLSAVVGSVCGSLVGALINYTINYHWTFRSSHGHRHAFPRFMAVAAIGLAVNAASMFVLTALLGLHYLLAQVVATGLVLLLGFVLNAKWTFGRKR